MDFEYTSEERRKPPAWVQNDAPGQPQQDRGVLSDTNTGAAATVFATTQPARGASPGFGPTSSNSVFTLHGAAGTSGRATPPPDSSWT
ncbi:hypothetical protein FRC17_007316, partial [Serendipita sp. 399]